MDAFDKYELKRSEGQNVEKVQGKREERLDREEPRRNEEQHAETGAAKKTTRMPSYKHITECINRTRNALKKITKSSHCDCHKTGRNCSDGECLNLACCLECPSSCRAQCYNQRFALMKNAEIEIFDTGSAKGFGLRAVKEIEKGRFIIEYVGEVIDEAEKEKRARRRNRHLYQMSIDSKFFIDATDFGNESRFANHCCEPNMRCEPWLVPNTPGDVKRVGFFATKKIHAGEELTFDYQFDCTGVAQRCRCGALYCSGWIGGSSKKIQGRIEEAAETNSSKDRTFFIENFFSDENSLDIQKRYAYEGMALLMEKWLHNKDTSDANLKLVHTILVTLKKDAFLTCAKEEPSLLKAVRSWMEMSMDDVDIVIGTMLEYVGEKGHRDYSKVQNEIMENLQEAQKLALNLDRHWSNKSVSFVIPKKIRPANEVVDEEPCSSGSADHQEHFQRQSARTEVVDANQWKSSWSSSGERSDDSKKDYSRRTSYSKSPWSSTEKLDAERHPSSSRYRSDAYKMKDSRRTYYRESSSRREVVDAYRWSSPSSSSKYRSANDRDNSQREVYYFNPPRSSRSSNSESSTSRKSSPEQKRRKIDEPETSGQTPQSPLFRVPALRTRTVLLPTPLAHGMQMIHPPFFHYPAQPHEWTMDCSSTFKYLDRFYKCATPEQLTTRMEHFAKDTEELKARIARVAQEFQLEIQKVVEPVVAEYLLDVREATPERRHWMVKLIVKEVFQQESIANNKQVVTDTIRKNARDYAKQLMERKIEANELWEGYSGR